MRHNISSFADSALFAENVIRNAACDSDLIINQKKYLEGYAAQQGYENIIHYNDDGYSGGS